MRDENAWAMCVCLEGSHWWRQKFGYLVPTKVTLSILPLDFTIHPTSMDLYF